MNRAFRTEYYPDMSDDPKGEFGKKVLTLSCTVSNGKRFRTLSQDEREILAGLIDVFQSQLSAFKKEITNGKYQTHDQ